MIEDKFQNERGNQVTHYPLGEGDRYTFDAAFTKKKGWQQYDTKQDASYFGIWVHIEARWIIQFIEGEVYKTECLDDEHLQVELDHLAEFYGDPPPAFKVIDQAGTLTNFYCERPGLK